MSTPTGNKEASPVASATSATDDNNNAASFTKRSAESARILQKFPDRIPVIVERAQRNTTLPQIDKRKFLVPGVMLCGEFKYIIHKHLMAQIQNEQQRASSGDASSRAAASAFTPEQTIYLFVRNNNALPRTGTETVRNSYVHIHMFRSFDVGIVPAIQRRGWLSLPGIQCGEYIRFSM